MHIHLLGICGTLMTPCALLAQELGHAVSGSDVQMGPPMGDILHQAAIPCSLDLDTDHLQRLPDDALILVGNKLRRGMPVTEALLNGPRAFLSAPAWLQQDVLRGRQVVVVAGTHGKTTTTAMIAWMLQHAGRDVGYLIGGLPKGFDAPAVFGFLSRSCFLPLFPEMIMESTGISLRSFLSKVYPLLVSSALL